MLDAIHHPTLRTVVLLVVKP
eukprot:COSAG01_NODE_2668_length_7278_cov_187.051957_1_plen_20_part_10